MISVLLHDLPNNIPINRRSTILQSIFVPLVCMHGLTHQWINPSTLPCALATVLGTGHDRSDVYVFGPADEPLEPIYYGCFFEHPRFLYHAEHKFE